MQFKSDFQLMESKEVVFIIKRDNAYLNSRHKLST